MSAKERWVKSERRTIPQGVHKTRQGPMSQHQSIFLILPTDTETSATADVEKVEALQDVF